MQNVDSYGSLADVLRNPDRSAANDRQYLNAFHVPPRWIRACYAFLLLLLPACLLAQQAAASDPALPDPHVLSSHNTPAPYVMTTIDGGVIHIRGKIVELASQEPFELAVIIIKCGNRVVASKHSKRNGTFLLTIPQEMAMAPTFGIRIKYLDHVFIQENLKLAPQEMLIEINGSIFMDNGLIEEYKLPVHNLGSPSVGKITSYLIKSLDKNGYPRS